MSPDNNVLVAVNVLKVYYLIKKIILSKNLRKWTSHSGTSMIFCQLFAIYLGKSKLRQANKNKQKTVDRSMIHTDYSEKSSIYLVEELLSMQKSILMNNE